MRASNNLINFLKGKESFRSKAYRLANESGYTIGFGNKFYENGKPVGAFDTITEARADQLLRNIVQQTANQVDQAVTVPLTQNQFDALVSYAYNRGIGRFRSTRLLQMVNQNPNNPAIYNQFIIEWGTNTAYREALMERRGEEATMYFDRSNGLLFGSGLISLFVLGFAVWLLRDESKQKYNN